MLTTRLFGTIRRFWLAGVIGWSLAAAFAGQEEQSVSAHLSADELPAEVKARLSGLLPLAGELGARPAEGPLFYHGGNLYEYIDGAAEAFNAFDFVALAHQVYDKGEAEVTVDVYDMGELENAFGIYSSERSPEYRFVNLGAEGYISESTVNFFQGRFYVKLSGFSEKEKLELILEAFARKISSLIRDGAEYPAGLALFPTGNLVAHTQGYIKRAPLGRDSLGPAFQARYAFDGKETEMIVSVAESPASAVERVRTLREQVARSGRAESLETPTGGFRGATRYEGELVAFPRGRYAVILVNPPKAMEEFIREIVARIPGS
jgi:hypothetical protein